jgi:hypothetical protein
VSKVTEAQGQTRMRGSIGHMSQASSARDGNRAREADADL